MEDVFIAKNTDTTHMNANTLKINPMDGRIQTILKDSTSTKNTSTNLDQPLNLFIKTITKFRLSQKI